MDAIGWAVLGKAIESGNPLALLLGLASTVVFGVILVGIRHDIQVLSKSLGEKITGIESRVLKLETKGEQNGFKR
jgi:hypothetical protein